MTKKTLKNKITRIRVDFFLTTEIPNLSRAQIQNFVFDGLIKVNNKVCKKKSQILEIGDRVEIQIPADEKIQPNKELKLNIIFEDQDLMIINKPAGLLVHPTNTEKQNTVSNAILAQYPEIKVGEKDRPGIVHRLDKDTSGILLIAKNLNAYKKLKELFKNHVIQKTYLAIVFGKPKEKELQIHTRQKRGTKDPTKNIVTYSKEGKEAITKARALKSITIKNKNVSLLELLPQTGRMHQLRLQLSYVGLPILGDIKYGSKKSIKLSDTLEIKRQLLHAYKIEFNIGKKNYKATAKIPQDIKKCINI